MKIHNDALMPLICACSAFIHFREELDAKNKILDAETRLASVAPAKYEFVDALRPTAFKIATARMEPWKETYIQICNNAAALLCFGMDQAEVLSHFDLIFWKASYSGSDNEKEGGD